ncbi:MAG: hypothetical protein JO280_09825 [Mycobacteriaceae bacterium]|nr:hypothetical protein [Mycobacteriaceae bacterium]
MYPNEEDHPTTVLDPAPTEVLTSARRRRLLGPRAVVLAAVVGALILAATATAAAVIVLGDGHRDVDAAPPADQPTAHTPTAQPPDAPSTGPAATGRGDASARQAWARQNGQNRSAMRDLPDVSAATPQQQAAAADLLARTQAGTAAYADTAKAAGAGFDVQAALSKAEKAQPRLAQRLARIDAGRAEANPPLLRVVNQANLRDGRVLDPSAPELLLYQYAGNNSWKLVGAGYIADESFPQPAPAPGGPITRWRYTDKHPAALTMDVFFTGNDLARAYALTPPMS